MSGFGSSGNWGQPPQNPQSSNFGGFTTSVPPPPPPSTSNVFSTPFPSAAPAFGTSSTTTFTSSSFPPSSTPFATSSSNAGNPFPASNAAAATPFATSANIANPFMTANSAAQQQHGAVSFGISASVVERGPKISSNAFTTQQVQPSNAFPSYSASDNPFGNQLQSQHSYNTTASTPFGISTTVTSAGTDSGMEDADEDQEYSNETSNLPFRQPFTADAPSSAKTTFSNEWTRSTSTMMSSSSPKPTIATSNDDDTEAKLAQLKAKLAKKKRIYEEKLQREKQAKQQQVLNPDATPFVPQGESESLLSSQQQQQRIDRFSVETSANNKTKTQLPADLQSSQLAHEVSLTNSLRNQGGRNGRENLQDAKALIGTCLYMCPDEEILRRERESDIQLLEQLDLGRIHPSHWTLRDTMVKRFRRSAADFKLDVPDWVRPPDVLERVCAYLEEWVMERDRQGPDPRFKNETPPSLDVYQFIWDRTRMVRKDFILQNYVGTGGMCDARAVRCHERIARWHCLCEHQLSHIEDYVRMQSQQNIQELGQTMKTLNQYYDDSLGRSQVEVPDEQGNETWTDLTSFKHGCEFDTVQGKNPIDFDGAILSNDESSAKNAKRLIGRQIGSVHHGTAEPEMRGLYILLTLDNDGGMEVLKYVARLYQKRPEVYNTVPVQLALSVFNAKNDSNYARFFSILKDSKTPYLFACVMFKYVESMRKLAIKICSRSYGGRARDSGESLYDAYPLQRFTRLCCYEDDEETRTALRHYNISFGIENGQEMVFWRRSSFKEPRDPEKGTIIPLRPWKMIKTIESKLQGATRLAICRGEVSGGDAYHSVNALLPDKGYQSNDALRGQFDEKVKAQTSLQEREQNQGNAMAKRLQEEAELRRRENEQKLEAEKERKRLDDEIKFQQQELMRQEEVRIRLERQQKEREQIELEKQTAIKKALELKRLEQLEEEREKELRRIQEQKKKDEEMLKAKMEEELRRQKKEEEKRIVEAEARKKLEAERIRREEEIHRLNELKRKQEEHALRLRQEKILEMKRRVLKRVTVAKKRYFWKRLVHETQQLSLANRTSKVLSMLGSPPNNLFFDSWERIPAENQFSETYPGAEFVHSSVQWLISSLEQTLKKNHIESIVTPIFAQKLKKSIEQKLDHLRSASTCTTFLIKVAVIFPNIFPSNHSERMVSLIRAWLDSRLCFATCFTNQSESVSLRVVFVESYGQKKNSVCDAAIFVIPCIEKAGLQLWKENLESMSSSVDANIPRVCFCVDPDLTSKYQDEVLNYLSGEKRHILVARPRSHDNSALDNCLLECCDTLVASILEEPKERVERASIAALFFSCVYPLLNEEFCLNSWHEIGEQTRSMVDRVVEELDKVHSRLRTSNISWPPHEFADSSGNVPNYFGFDAGLPLNWMSTSSRLSTEPKLMRYVAMMDGGLKDVVLQLTWDAPSSLTQICQHLLDRQLYRKCLERALFWRKESDERSIESALIFLPAGLLEDILKDCISSELAKTRTLMPNCYLVSSDNNQVVSLPPDNFKETIDLPPQSTPCTATNVRTIESKRVWKDALLGQNQAANQHRSTLVSQRTTARKKRRVMSQERKELLESTSYTRKLERIAMGTQTIDMILGTGEASTTLSSTLRGAPMI